MNFTELKRARDNEKVKLQVEVIVEQCRAGGFSVADMKDLAAILPQEIRKAIISVEEKTMF